MLNFLFRTRGTSAQERSTVTPAGQGWLKPGPFNLESSVLTIWHQPMPAELNGNKISKERIKVYQFVVTLLIYTYTYIQEIAIGRIVFYMLIFFTKGFLSMFLSTCFSELL